MSHADRDVWPDNPAELAAWLLFVGLIGAQVAWVAAPALPYDLHDEVVGDVLSIGTDGSDTALAVAEEDRRYLNRIYREQSNEVVYCGLLDGSTLSPWLARLVATSPHAATFSASDCPASPSGHLVNVHTHPNGATTLSEADATLFDRGYRYVCVQGGAIEADAGERTRALRCYAEADGVVEVPVRIVADG